MNKKQYLEKWDLKISAHRTNYFWYSIALLLIAVHILVGVFLSIGFTGVIFQTYDRVSIGLLGFIFAGLILIFTRSEVCIGPAGILIRNLYKFKLILWIEVIDISFPVGSFWARVNLPKDEYIPLVAVQVFDKTKAVQAMCAIQELVHQYCK